MGYVAVVLSVLKAIPRPVWMLALGALLGAAGTHLWHASNPPPPDEQTVTVAAPKAPSEAAADPWSMLTVHRRDTTQVVDTTCAVVPESVLDLSTRDPQNGLPEVTYDTGGASLPSIDPPVRLPYAILPLTAGRSPTVGVSPNEVTLHARNPKTGQGLTWRWAVPKPAWTVSAGVGVSAEVLGGESIGPVQQSVSLEVTRSFEDWSATTIGGVSGRGPTVGVEVRYDLFTLGTQ